MNKKAKTKTKRKNQEKNNKNNSKYYNNNNITNMFIFCISILSKKQLQ